MIKMILSLLRLSWNFFLSFSFCFSQFSDHTSNLVEQGTLEETLESYLLLRPYICQFLAFALKILLSIFFKILSFKKTIKTR